MRNRTAAAATRSVKEPSGNTRALILDEAIELFSLNGFHLTTIRQISEAAGQNVAAIHYHFGSKDALVEEVIDQVFRPVNERRIEALKRAQEQFAPALPPIEGVVEALVSPLVACRRTRDGGRASIRLQMHLKATPSHPYYVFLQKRFNYAARPFIKLLQELMPGYSRSEVIWRYEMVRGAAMHILSNFDPLSDKLQILAEGTGIGDLNDDQAVLEEIVAFCTRGLTAPVALRERPSQGSVVADAQDGITVAATSASKAPAANARTKSRGTASASRASQA